MDSFTVIVNGWCKRESGTLTLNQKFSNNVLDFGECLCDQTLLIFWHNVMLWGGFGSGDGAGCPFVTRLMVQFTRQSVLKQDTKYQLLLVVRPVHGAPLMQSIYHLPCCPCLVSCAGIRQNTSQTKYCWYRNAKNSTAGIFKCYKLDLYVGR